MTDPMIDMPWSTFTEHGKWYVVATPDCKLLICETTEAYAKRIVEVHNEDLDQRAQYQALEARRRCRGTRLVGMGPGVKGMKPCPGCVDCRTTTKESP